MPNSLGQDSGAAGDWAPRGIDVNTPSVARMYDYYLGGKHHYPADREAAEKVLAAVPDLTITTRENRKFLGRAVRIMTEAGIQQFLDLGAGLPTQENVHQVAQAANPDARVVYVDNDPVTLAHARALLATDTQTAVVDANLRYPGQVLSNPVVTELIDFDEPVGVLFVAILHFIPDDENPAGIVAAFRGAIPSGSYLALSHGTGDEASPDEADEGTRPYQQATSTITLRTREQVHDLFTGFELLEPGIAPVQQWRNHSEDTTTRKATILAGLGYKA